MIKLCSRAGTGLRSILAHRIHINALLLAVTVAAVTGGVRAELPERGIYAAYVLFGRTTTGDTVPMARVITAANRACPALVWRGGKSAENISMQRRTNPDPERFPVHVCEARYPFARPMRVEGTSIDLPAVHRHVSSVHILGDTGCDPDKTHPDAPCRPGYWPFSALAHAVAGTTTSADLLVHVGDYDYRGTPGKIRVRGQTVRVYDAGDHAPRGECRLPGPYYEQNSAASETPNRWETWWLDYFQPAQTLLPAAPWIFLRGNHELCSRAGPGWFYLLDSNSALLGEGAAQLTCPPAGSESPHRFTPPWVADLGNLDLIVLDSANACDSGLLHADTYAQQFSSIRKQYTARSDKPSWLLSHRPLWGVVKSQSGGSCSNGDTPEPVACINQTLQYAVDKHPLPDTTRLVVSGHMHRFQAINPGESGVAQLVIGNSGVRLAANIPGTSFTLPHNGGVLTGMGLSEFGWMKLTLTSPEGWTGQLINPLMPAQSALRATCQSVPLADDQLCSITKGVD